MAQLSTLGGLVIAHHLVEFYDICFRHKHSQDCVRFPKESTDVEFFDPLVYCATFLHGFFRFLATFSVAGY